jgi:hypothetical protein
MPTRRVEPDRQSRCHLSQRGAAVLNFESVEEVCESKNITLVLHPVIRRAVKGFEESFYIGLRCFLTGESDGLYFLPLETGGYVRLVFSQRQSPGGHPILRVDPLTTEGLHRVKAAVSARPVPPRRQSS